MAQVLVGCDVGGTFTDAVALEPASGRTASAKAPTTPHDQAEGVCAAVTLALERLGARPEDVAGVLHGTTTATNAVLENALARVALVTHRGMEDLVEIGRQARPSLYDLTVTRPPALVDRADRHGVRGRLDAVGNELEPLDAEELDALGQRLADDRPDVVAVCFVHAHRSGAHEAAAAARLAAALPGTPVVTSHGVSPEFREVERFTTTLVNAGLVPRLSRYLERLVERLGALGVPGNVAVLDSAGALLSTEEAARLPVRTVLSGPAGGATACVRLSQELAEPDLVGVDMGGTSTDVTLVVGGRPTERWQAEIGGYPLQVPTADIHTVGAGGGSIAWVDEGGGLRVGPRSAGAEPGPACYGRGGTEPTVTDANLVLGCIPADARLGGSTPLQLDLARAAVERLGDALGQSTEEAARGVLAVAGAVAVRGIRKLLARHAADPASLALVAFGGAGPLFGAEWAGELGIRRVLVPHGAGVGSAAGLLAAPPRLERSRTLFAPVDDRPGDAIDAAFQALEDDALAALDRDDAETTRLASARYVGQSHELTVPVAGAHDVRARFEAAHEARFGYRLEDAPVELVTARARAQAPPAITPERPTTTPLRDGPEPAGRMTTWFDTTERPLDAARFEAAALQAGHAFEGPAVVIAEDATALVPPGWRATVVGPGHLVLVEEGVG